jgi:two-component system invasion response regulator UvrY
MSGTQATGGALGTGSRLVRVLMVDDQPLFRNAARAVIGATAEFESVAEVPSGEDALALVAALRPDVALVDVSLPGIDGFETSRRLAAAHPLVLVVLLSAEDDPHLRASAGSCGAGAFLRKQELHPSTLRELWERHRAITPTG